MPKHQPRVPVSELPPFRNRYLRQRFEEGVQKVIDRQQTNLFCWLLHADQNHRREFNFLPKRQREKRIRLSQAAANREAARLAREARSGVFAAKSIEALAVMGRSAAPLTAHERRQRCRWTAAAFVDSHPYTSYDYALVAVLQAWDETGRPVMAMVLPAADVELIESTYRTLTRWRDRA